MINNSLYSHIRHVSMCEQDIVCLCFCLFKMGFISCSFLGESMWGNRRLQVYRRQIISQANEPAGRSPKRWKGAEREHWFRRVSGHTSRQWLWLGVCVCLLPRLVKTQSFKKATRGSVWKNKRNPKTLFVLSEKQHVYISVASAVSTKAVRPHFLKIVFAENK